MSVYSRRIWHFILCNFKFIVPLTSFRISVVLCNRNLFLSCYSSGWAFLVSGLLFPLPYGLRALHIQLANSERREDSLISQNPDLEMTSLLLIFTWWVFVTKPQLDAMGIQSFCAWMGSHSQWQIHSEWKLQILVGSQLSPATGICGNYLNAPLYCTCQSNVMLGHSK